jgi:hypothetical protein
MDYTKVGKVAELLKEFAIENKIPVLISRQLKTVFRKEAKGLTKKRITEIFISGTFDHGKSLAAICILQQRIDEQAYGEFVVKVE